MGSTSEDDEPVKTEPATPEQRSLCPHCLRPLPTSWHITDLQPQNATTHQSTTAREDPADNAMSGQYQGQQQGQREHLDSTVREPLSDMVHRDATTRQPAQTVQPPRTAVQRPLAVAWHIYDPHFAARMWRFDQYPSTIDEPARTNNHGATTSSMTERQSRPSSRQGGSRNPQQQGGSEGPTP